MIRSALLDKLVFWLNGGRFHNHSRNNIGHRPGAPKIAFLALQLQAEQSKFQKSGSKSIKLEKRLSNFSLAIYFVVSVNITELDYLQLYNDFLKRDQADLIKNTVNDGLSSLRRDFSP